MIPEKTCRFYLTEEDGELVHTRRDGGICILKDLFSDCSGICGENDSEE